jgi:adenylyl cyclase-associated protein
MVFSEH